MTRCWQCPNPGRPYLGYLGHRARMWCDDCHAKAVALGVDLTPVERREEFRPRWLDNLRAKDMTGGSSAA